MWEFAALWNSKLRGALSIGKPREVSSQLVSDTAKERQPFFLRSLELGGIIEASVNSNRSTREDWAAFLRVITNCQDIVERLTCEFVHTLRSVTRDINAQFAHNGDRLGPDPTRPRACAEHLEVVARAAPQQTFRHLASRGIPGAENKDSFLIRHACSLVEDAQPPPSTRLLVTSAPASGRVRSPQPRR